MISVWNLVAGAIWRLRGRFIGLAAVLVVSAITVTVGTCLGTYAAAESAAAIDDSSTLKTIMIYRDGQPIDPAAIERLRKMEGAAQVEPVLSVVVGLEYSRSALTVFALNSLNQPPLVDGTIGDDLAEDQIILPAEADGMSLAALLGRSADISYTVAVTADAGVTERQSMEVVALADPSYQIDAPLAAYANSATVLRLAAVRAGLEENVFLADYGYEKAIVVAQSQSDVAGLTARIQASGLQAVSTLQQLDDVPGAVSLIRFVTNVLFVALLALSLICTIVITHSVTRQRIPEVALLKTYGWRPRRIRAILALEIIAVTVTSLAVGIGAGVVAAVLGGSPLIESFAAGQLGTMTVPAARLILGGIASTALVAAAAYAVITRATNVSVAEVMRSIR